MSFRFFSLPAYRLVPPPQFLPEGERLEPELSSTGEALQSALGGAEYRSVRARDRLLTLFGDDTRPDAGSPGAGWSPSAFYAQPPNDLPALLRLADQLDHLARQDAGERALTWRCRGCGTSYAVPVALFRPVTIRCERCTQPVELSVAHTLGEQTLGDPGRGIVSQTRRQLAAFFRESMARGWPVLVSRQRPAK